jgi:hypothetical protein
VGAGRFLSRIKNGYSGSTAHTTANSPTGSGMFRGLWHRETEREIEASYSRGVVTYSQPSGEESTATYVCTVL